MASHPYDIALTMSGTKYGFMLTTPPGEPKQLIVSEVPHPAGQYDLNRLASEDTRNATDFEQQYDAVLAQSSFAGGVGQLDVDVRAEPDMCWWAPGVILHVPGKAFLAQPVTTLAITSGAAEVTGSLSYLTSGGTRYDFHWQGARLYRRDASNGTNAWGLVYAAGATITNFYIFGGGGYICAPSVSGSTDFLYQADVTAAATWTPTARDHTAFSDALGKPKFFSSVRGTMYAAVDARKIWYSVDPTTDAWTGPIDTSLTGNFSGPPGDGTYTFTNLKAANDFLFPFKQDAGYNIDSQQEVTEVLWQWKDKPSSDNFKHVAVGGDLLYYSMTPEVYAYDPQTGRNLPMMVSRMSGASVKDILGVAADNNFTYILVKARVPGIRSADCAALLRCWRTSATTWASEVLWEDTASTAYSGLHAAPNGAGTRVYWYQSDGTDSLHMDCPADWDESTGSTFATSGTLYVSTWRTGFAAFTKRWLWITTQMGYAAASNTMAVAYSIDGGTTFTTLATLAASGLAFTDFSNIQSDAIILRFTFASAGTVTPVLRSFDLHGRVRWRYLQQAQATVRVADYVELDNGTRASERAVDLVTNLEALRTGNAAILFEDFLGRSFYVSVDSLAYRATRHEVPDSRWEQEAQLILSQADSGD
jgi:hypothetical protein